MKLISVLGRSYIDPSPDKGTIYIFFIIIIEPNLLVGAPIAQDKAGFFLCFLFFVLF